jgi:hypothetical protein
MRQHIRLAALGVGALLLAGCVEDALVPPPPPKDSEVMHYWHFNNLPAGELTTPVPADQSKVGTPQITYPGTGAGFMDRVDPGTDLNAQSGFPAGFGIRPRNPATTREFLIVAPSTGYEKLVVSFAVQRSNNGPEQQQFQYSTDGGTTWVPVGAAYDIAAIAPDWERKVISLENITAVNNSAALRFRILLQGPSAAGASGNHRMDNLTIEGIPQ